MKNRSAFVVGSDEAASLYFIGPTKPRVPGYPIRAMIILASGEHYALLEATLNPTEPEARRPFIRRLVKLCPAIDPLYAEERLIEFAASRKIESVEAESPIASLCDEPVTTMVPHIEETVTSPASPAVLTPAEKMLLDPNLMALIVEDVQALGVAGEGNLISLVYLAATSRWLQNPLSLIVSSGTGTGKSFTVNQTLRCIPPGEKVVLTKLTQAALYRLCDADPNALKHKVLVLGEMKKQKGAAEADATADLRQLISEGEISRVIADTSGNDASSQRLQVVKGPIAFIQTTTNSCDDIFDENLNRCLLLKTDASPAQTQRVIERTAAKAAGLTSVDEDAIINRHHEMQGSLQKYEVIIPYAPELTKAFPLDRAEVRRAFEKFCGVIMASALLHQKQREVDPAGRLVATLADYAIARRLCSEPLEQQLGRRISVPAIKFHGQLLAWPKLQTVDGSMKWNTEFTVGEARELNSKSDTTVRNWLKELATIGAVDEITPGKGQRSTRWRLTGMSLEEVESRGISLPEANELAVRLGLATTQVQLVPPCSN